MSVRVDRWNAGRLRRYHLASGAVAVVLRHAGVRRCAVLPAWCNHISVPVTPAALAAALREARDHG